MELPQKYPREHYQQKASRYASTLRLLFRVQVDESTKNRWSDLILMSRSIDQYLDSADNKSTFTQRSNTVADFLHQPEAVEQQYPALAIEDLGEQTYANMKRWGSAILRVNAFYKTQTSLRRYALLRRLEGRYYAHLITSVATPATADQPGYDIFRRWLVPTGEITNLVNSFYDIHRDYKNGEIELTPDHTSRPQLLRHIAVAALQAKRIAASAAEE